MDEVIFMFLYDSTFESYDEVIKIKGLSCIDLKDKKYNNKIKSLPILMIHHQKVTKTYKYTPENLEMITLKIKELFN